MKRISLVRLPGSTPASGASAAMPKPRAQFRAAGHACFARSITGWPTKTRLQSVFLEERHLERKQRQHQIEIARHGARAIGAAGPDLRRDIIDRADRGIAPLQAPRDAMGEIGTVDQHDRIGSGCKREIARPRARGAGWSECWAPLRAVPSPRCRRAETELCRPCAAMARPPTPVILTLSPADRLQARHQLAAELIAGRLAANEHQRDRFGWKRAHGTARRSRTGRAGRPRRRPRACRRSAHRPLRRRCRQDRRRRHCAPFARR